MIKICSYKQLSQQLKVLCKSCPVKDIDTCVPTSSQLDASSFLLIIEVMYSINSNELLRDVRIRDSKHFIQSIRLKGLKFDYKILINNPRLHYIKDLKIIFAILSRSGKSMPMRLSYNNLLLKFI